MHEEMCRPDGNDRGDDKHKNRDYTQRGASLIRTTTATGQLFLILGWPAVAVAPHVTPGVVLIEQRDRRRGVQWLIGRVDRCATTARLW
jgi:hypothetical protein